MTQWLLSPETQKKSFFIVQVDQSSGHQIIFFSFGNLVATKSFHTKLQETIQWPLGHSTLNCKGRFSGHYIYIYIFIYLFIFAWRHGGHQVVPCNLGSSFFFFCLGNKEIQVPNPILLFRRIFFNFMRGDLNLVLKNKIKTTI